MDMFPQKTFQDLVPAFPAECEQLLLLCCIGGWWNVITTGISVRLHRTLWARNIFYVTPRLHVTQKLNVL